MGRPAALRAINRAQILRTVLKEGALSRSEIAERTGISSVTVTYIVNDLLTEQVLSEWGRTEGSSGRPAQKVDLNPAAGTVLGIDVQPDHLLVGHTTLRGDLTEFERIELQAPQQVTQTILKVLEQHRVHVPQGGPVQLLVLGVPAPVNAAGELGSPNSLPELEVEQIHRGCQQLGVQLLLENDANLCALAEHQLGVVKGEKHFAFLLERPTGVGLGLYLEGQLYRGQRGLAGELALARWASNGIPVPLEDLRGAEQEKALAYLVAGLALSLDLSAVVVHQEAGTSNPQLLNSLQALVTPNLQVVSSALGAQVAVMGALTRGSLILQDHLLALPEF